MHSVFQIYATTKGAVAKRYAALCLPATPYELLDVLDKTRVKNAGELRVEVEECLRFPQLLPLLSGEIDLCQLNALAQKLSELDDWQSIAFEGLVKMEVEKRKSFSIPRLIDLACSADCCYVAVDVEDDAALGRFYAGNGFIPKVEDLSDELFDLLNFEKIGQECRVGEGGVFTSGGYVVQHTESVEAYKAMDLTPKAPDYAVLLEITKGHFSDPAHDSGKTVRFPLPAEPAAIDEVLTAVDALNWREVDFRCLDCRVPSLISRIDDDDNIAHINHLAQKLQSMDSDELTKLKAVLEIAESFSVTSAINTIDSLDGYRLSAQISDPEEVARERLVAILSEQDAEKLIPHLNLYTYGQSLMREQKRIMTAYGLVSREGKQSLSLMEQDRVEML